MKKIHDTCRLICLYFYRHIYYLTVLFCFKVIFIYYSTKKFPIIIATLSISNINTNGIVEYFFEEYMNIIKNGSVLN